MKDQSGDTLFHVTDPCSQWLAENTDQFLFRPDTPTCQGPILLEWFKWDYDMDK